MNKRPNRRTLPKAGTDNQVKKWLTDGRHAPCCRLIGLALILFAVILFAVILGPLLGFAWGFIPLSLGIPMLMASAMPNDAPHSDTHA